MTIIMKVVILRNVIQGSHLISSSLYG